MPDTTEGLQLQEWTGQEGEWNQIVYGSPFATTLQDFRYGECKRNAGSRILRLAWSFPGGEIAAIGQAVVRRFLRTGVAFFPRGPVFVSEPDEDLVRAVYGSLRAYCKSRSIILAKVTPNFRQEDFAWYDLAIENAGHQKSFKKTIHRRTSRVDLSKPIDEVFAGFKSRTRRRIRGTDYSTIKLNFGHGEELLERFFHVFRQTAERGGFRGHTLDYCKKFVCAQQDGFARIFEISHNEETLASAVILSRKTHANYLWGGSATEKGRLSPGIALHWFIIQQLHKEGVQCYDLQGIPLNPEQGKEGWGRYQFKRGFGGEEVTLVGEFDIVPHPWLHRFARKCVNLQTRLSELRLPKFRAHHS